MSLKTKTACDNCQKRLEEGNLVYCRDCYFELEDTVNELEKKIEALEHPEKQQKKEPFLFPTKEEVEESEEDQDPDCPF